jgi:putative ABC transport system permease protein
MELSNIIASMRRNKLSAALVIVQIALAMAIVSNGVFVIVMRNQQAREPSGLDERNIFTIANQLVTGLDQEARSLALLEQDLQVLRTTPGVIDAYTTGSIPLIGRYETSPVGRTLAQVENDTGGPLVTSFHVDDHALRALGLKLIAGRWFYPKEVVKTFARPDSGSLPQIIVTQALAEKLFPQGGALGSVVYQSTTGQPGPSTIIGIIDTLRIPGEIQAAASGPYSYVVPWLRPSDGGTYVVRVHPGRLASVMRDAEQRLRAANPLRVILSIEPYTQTRWEAFRLPRSTVFILITVCALLLIITACGIVGLTSYWIAQRRHHIGMRRALGARRMHILAYYQIENLFIAGLGAAVGVALAAGVNLWLMRTFAVQRLDWSYLIVGAITVLVLGQLAAFWPAFRAASIPPALAARAR